MMNANETPSPGAIGDAAAATESGVSNEPVSRKCTCGKKPGTTGRHKDGCALRQPGVVRHNGKQAHHVMPQRQVAEDVRFSDPQIPASETFNEFDSEPGLETGEVSNEPTVHSLVPADDSYALLAEAFVGLLKGAEAIALTNIRRDGVVIGGETFAADTLKDVGTTADEYDRIKRTGEVLARKHGMKVEYMEEIGFCVAVGSPAARIIYAMRKLHAKADEVLKAQRQTT